jgi:hypothetical protein
MDRFGPRLTFEEYGKSHLSVLAKKIPVELHGLGATVWNRIVTKRWHQVDPCQFAPYFHTKSPDLHLAISKLLKIEVIRDIYYVKGWRGPKKRSNLVLELLVAWLYRNDLHLGDITFINPDRPIPKANRKHELQTHEGLGLLPVLLENMHLKAKELGCNQQTLTAAMTENVALFRRFGFDVEDSEFTRLALELGFGIPMEKDL